jgi:hypothetical protein
MAAISPPTNARRANGASFGTTRNATTSRNGNAAERARRLALPFALPLPRYFELIERHGNLKPLVDIKISAPYLVRTRLVYNQITHEKVIDVRQTVQQFKKYVHELYQIPLARVRIFHVDDVAFSMGIGGPDEMKYPQRFLHAYVIARRLSRSRWVARADRENSILHCAYREAFADRCSPFAVTRATRTEFRTRVVVLRGHSTTYEIIDRMR